MNKEELKEQVKQSILEGVSLNDIVDGVQMDIDNYFDDILAEYGERYNKAIQDCITVIDDYQDNVSPWEGIALRAVISRLKKLQEKDV